ncbi:hypothetical protein PS2_018426 [Malus domestica]
MTRTPTAQLGPRLDHEELRGSSKSPDSFNLTLPKPHLLHMVRTPGANGPPSQLHDLLLPRSKQVLVCSRRPSPKERYRVTNGVSSRSTSTASGVTNGVSGMQSVLLSSKYLKVAHELLDEVVNVGNGMKTELLIKG